MMEQWAQALVCRMKEGDREAFDQLAEHFYPELLRMAYLISGSHTDSEDIVQETCILCWINRKKIREPEHIRRWLYKTLTREAWRVSRESKREQPMEAVYEENVPGKAAVLEEVLAHSRQQELYKAIAGLPVKQRTTVVLYYYNDLSAREIAGIMGCLEGTVKSRLFTARRNLKETLMKNHQWNEKEAVL